MVTKNGTRLVLLAAASAWIQGCAIFGVPRGVNFSSDPPGARIMVNGRDSGFVTPCMLEMDPDKNVRVDFVLVGFRPATRMLVENTEVYAVLWKEMYIRDQAWNFPLWLNVLDFFGPIHVTDTLSPSRVYVRLERVADEPSMAREQTQKISAR